MSIENKEFVIGALIGSGIAAAAVLLFTPRSGAKVREMVQGFVNGDSHTSNHSHPRATKHANGKIAHAAHHKTVHKKTAAKDDHHEKPTSKKPRRKPVA